MRLFLPLMPTTSIITNKTGAKFCWAQGNNTGALFKRAPPGTVQHDESGEYALHIRDQNGLGTVKKIDLGQPPSYYYGPTWSPDSKKIAYSDKRLNL